MTVYQQAWDQWGALNAGAEGHLAELDVLHEHAPGADLVSYGMSGGQPCVVGTDSGRLVVATETGFASEVGPAVFGRYGSSFRLSAGALTVEYLSLPACESISAALGRPVT